LKLLTVRPNQHDSRFALGDLEAVVLGQLWASNRPLTVRELQSMTVKSRPVAVTTVATILDRLYRKGFVSRQLVKQGGPHYLYKAKMTEDEFKQNVVANVMGGLLQSFNDVTVSYLTEKMHPERSDEPLLAKYLNRLRKKERK
jgi:predicted transcriptional regulator